MPSIGVLEHNQKPTDKPKKHVKRAHGQLQVKRGLACWIIKNVLLKLFPPHVKGLKEMALPIRTEPSEPSSSVGMGKLKWEPPKSKRDFKAHPWANKTFEARI